MGRKKKKGIDFTGKIASILDSRTSGSPVQWAFKKMCSSYGTKLGAKGMRKNNGTNPDGYENALEKKGNGGLKD